MATLQERMMKALDTHKPDWFIVYANQQELTEYTRTCTDGHSGTVAPKIKLRRDVLERMWDILRAGVTAEIVEFAAPKSD